MSDDEGLREGVEAPPPGTAAMAVVRWLLLIGVAAAAAQAWWSFAHADPAAEHAPKYMCPMHPQITSATAPGECPICHMALEPVHEEQGAGDSLYRCPMHPEQTSTGPGRCPVCGMDLEASAGAAPPGTAPMTLALDRLQAIGVRTAEARERGFSPELRVAARTELSEDGAARVHVRAAGFIERVLVDQTGARVHKGQRLAEYYSPEIYQAQAELIAARGWAGGQALEAARLRLELLGVPAATVERVLKVGKPERTLAIVAPASGVVIERRAAIGAYVGPEEPLYELRDDRVLYLIAEVPAARAAGVRVGLSGQASFPGDPARREPVEVDLVYPTADPGSRALRARMPLGNRDRAHVAGEPALVTFALPELRGVAVPRDAVVETGTRPYVFVDRGGGRLEPRLVELGVRDDEDVLISAGVHAGERVVAGATFLIDAESRLRAALAPARAP